LPTQDRSVKRTFGFFFAAFGLATVIIILWAVAYAMKQGAAAGWLAVAAAFFQAIALCGMLSLAATALGGLLGFIFGIPRSLQDGSGSSPRSGASDNATNPSAASAPSNPSAPAPAAVRWSSNTNLEQVSDWLTKILVGVGLTQLSTFVAAVENGPQYLSDHGFPAEVGGPFFGVVIILAFVVIGFLGGYLMTRLFLARQIARADAELADLSDKAAAVRQIRLDVELGEAELTPAIKAAAAAIAARPLEELSAPDQVLAWAKAQAILGNLADMRRGFAALLQLADTIRNRLEYGRVLDALDLWGDAEEQFAIAAAKAEVLRDFPSYCAAETAVLAVALYQGPPEGYSKALRVSERLIAQGWAVIDRRVFAYRAAALGQRYRDPNSGTTQQERKAIRDAALEAVKLAVVDPVVRALVEFLWNKDEPQKKKEPLYARENDLEVFFDDPEFRQAIKGDQPAPPPPPKQTAA